MPSWVNPLKRRAGIGDPRRPTDDSISNPLQIDALPLGDRGGEIGMTLCPGRRGSSPFIGVWDRDLETDLDVICAWGADVVVSLIEPEEFEVYGVVELSERVRARGLRHMHLPIADMGIPNETFEAAWIESGAELRRMLLDGRRVLLHCLAGLGRTGTIAARLLIELGAEPDEAIAAVREARPGTIQTLLQELYVRRFSTVNG